MKRAKKPELPPAPPRYHLAQPLVAITLTLGAAAGLLFGLSHLGDEARRRIGPRDRYAVPFADIRCATPPDTTRDTFLTEVRYTSGLGATVQVLDPDLTQKLTAAFQAHPWVASLDGVTVAPPNEVSVALTFRKPVLAIGVWAVDAKGVLLPRSASIDGLPALLNGPRRPDGAAPGQVWPSAEVVRAAAVALEYKPRTIERTAQGWELIQTDGRKLLVAK